MMPVTCKSCELRYLDHLSHCPGCDTPRVEQTRQEKWDLRFMELAKHYAGWSKDPSTQIGAVVVDSLNRQLGQGYNGFPRGVNDDPERYANREEKYPLVVHAELNAILNCTLSPRGATLYVYPLPPCPECTKAIIQSGIKRVVISSDCDRPEWMQAFRRHSKVMLDEAGVGVSIV